MGCFLQAWLRALDRPFDGEDLWLAALTDDSRLVVPGAVFLAYPGAVYDGRDGIAVALARGARVIVFEPQGFEIDVAWQGRALFLPWPGLKRERGRIAACFYGAPSKEMTMVGVTGTNGKTTCVHWLAQSLEALRLKVALVGTLGTGFLGDVQGTG